MIEVFIVNKNGEKLFSYKGEKVDVTYNQEYSLGDKIVIHKKGEISTKKNFVT